MEGELLTGTEIKRLQVETTPRIPPSKRTVVIRRKDDQLLPTGREVGIIRRTTPAERKEAATFEEALRPTEEPTKFGVVKSFIGEQLKPPPGESFFRPSRIKERVRELKEDFTFEGLRKEFETGPIKPSLIELKEIPRFEVFSNLPPPPEKEFVTLGKRRVERLVTKKEAEIIRKQSEAKIIGVTKATKEFITGTIIPKVKEKIKGIPAELKATKSPLKKFEKKGLLTPEEAERARVELGVVAPAFFLSIKKEKPSKLIREQLVFGAGLKVAGAIVKVAAPLIPGFKKFGFQDLPPIVPRSKLISQSKKGIEITHATPSGLKNIFGKGVDELNLKKLIQLEQKSQQAVVLAPRPRVPTPRSPIEKSIFSSTKNTGAALTGARAQNLQVLPQFTRKTIDIDFKVVSGSTKAAAQKTATRLNRDIGIGRFSVKKGGRTDQGGQIFKVIDQRTGKSIADFAPGKAPTIKVNGQKVVRADFLLKRKSIITQQELQQFRRSKDIGDIERLTGGKILKGDILKPSTVGRTGFKVSKALGIKGAGRERLGFARRAFQKTGKELGEFGLFFAPKVTRLFFKGERGGILFIKKGPKITLPTGRIAQRIRRGEVGERLRLSLALKRKPGQILPGQRALGLGRGEQEFEVTEATKLFKQTILPQFTVDPLTGKFIPVREIGLKKPPSKLKLTDGFLDKPSTNLKAILKEQKEFFKQIPLKERLKSSKEQLLGIPEKKAKTELEKQLKRLPKKDRDIIRRDIIPERKVTIRDITRRVSPVETRRALGITRRRPTAITRRDVIRPPSKRVVGREIIRKPIARKVVRDITREPPIRGITRTIIREPRRITGRDVFRVVPPPPTKPPKKPRLGKILKKEKKKKVRKTRELRFAPSLAAVFARVIERDPLKVKRLLTGRLDPIGIRPLTTSDPISRRVLGLDKPTRRGGFF